MPRDFGKIALARAREKEKKNLKKKEKLEIFLKARPPDGGQGTPLRGGSVRGQMRPNGRRASKASSAEALMGYPTPAPA